MVKNTETILIEARQLPVQERSALASRLIASLDERVDEGVDAAWDAEIAKRLEEIDEGRYRWCLGSRSGLRCGGSSMALRIDVHPAAQAEITGALEYYEDSDPLVAEDLDKRTTRPFNLSRANRRRGPLTFTALVDTSSIASPSP